MNGNHLKELESLGQSIWLDYIRRDFIENGQLLHLIKVDGLRGMTSNPSIFETAIAESDIYDQDIRALALNTKDVNSIYESISQRDVQLAADIFLPLYLKSKGMDGYVSLEVNPNLAYDTEGTISEGIRLWSALNRPNVLIKVPATLEGLPAIRCLISLGINVNATLLFSLGRYRQVAEAFISGLQDHILHVKSPKKIASVASFFLSRIDTEIDSKGIDLTDGTKEQLTFSAHLEGQVAIASAKLAYQIYREVFENEQFLKLEAAPQRLLWASISPKNPKYDKLKYMEALIGSNTVSTIPLETLDTYCEKGKPQPLLETDLIRASSVLTELKSLGIDLEKTTEKLEKDGVVKFIQAYDKLMKVLSNKISTNS